MTGEYDDIITLPHHRSKTRSPMSVHDRAAQFSPFAALTGFESAVDETGRLTDSRRELEEYGRDTLDRAMIQLQELLPQHPKVCVTYFAPDDRKDGGAYTSLQGHVKKVDLYRQTLVFMDGKQIPLSDILRIESEGIEEE